GSQAAYSNLAFDLLADALATASGKPYTQLFEEKITRPLGMKDRRHIIRAFLLGIGFPDQRADCAGRHGLNRPLCSSPGGPSRSTA
ncbi:serine hydrolase, partial [Salmonella enterica subsp. enterica serovar Anatum]|nr:serine hydrolase [Salmonella enterica subsp. enterica serovar Anatum]